MKKHVERGEKPTKPPKIKRAKRGRECNCPSAWAVKTLLVICRTLSDGAKIYVFMTFARSIEETVPVPEKIVAIHWNLTGVLPQKQITAALYNLEYVYRICTHSHQNSPEHYYFSTFYGPHKKIFQIFQEKFLINPFSIQSPMHRFGARVWSCSTRPPPGRQRRGRKRIRGKRKSRRRNRKKGVCGRVFAHILSI